jgi:ubiquinone/menaquinone biosynthesis C-methylase UbiE
MKEAEFDKFADEYHALHAASIAASGEGTAYFAEYKIRDLLREYTRSEAGGDPPAVLDFGSGSGSSIDPLLRLMPGARLTCMDVSKRSLELAESRYAGHALFVLFEGARLPASDASFDIVFAACVFHHIDHGEHPGLLREWRRVLRPGDSR